MDAQTEAAMRSRYKETICGYVCTTTEDEYIEMAKNLGPGRVLDLRETKRPTAIDLDKEYVFAALKAGEVVFQPVIVLTHS